jgi:hypothetical protein
MVLNGNIIKKNMKKKKDLLLIIGSARWGKDTSLNY